MGAAKNDSHGGRHLVHPLPEAPDGAAGPGRRDQQSETPTEADDRHLYDVRG
jgi:hypothetical protein